MRSTIDMLAEKLMAKKSHENETNMHFSVGIAIGIILGTCAGIMMGNIALGIGVGTAIGIAIGGLFSITGPIDN